MENNNIENLTQQQRLVYLIKKYFENRSEFANKADINVDLITKFLNNKAKKIATKNLIKIEKNVGFSMDFVLNGTGEELIEGCELKPLIPIKVPVISNKINDAEDKKKYHQEIRGEATKMTLGTSGRNMMLCDVTTANIVDIMFDGIESPLILQLTNEEFRIKYGYKNDSTIVVNHKKHKEGDIVLIHSKSQFIKYCLCDCIDDKFYDIKPPHTEIKDNIEIIGAVYTRAEKF